jgi:hypothetical protein
MDITKFGVCNGEVGGIGRAEMIWITLRRHYPRKRVIQ